VAKTSYVDILPGLENQFFTGLRSDDRFIFSKVVKKIALLSAKKKKGLSQRSMLPAVAALWAGLSAEEKDVWNVAPSGGQVAFFGVAGLGISIFGKSVTDSGLNGWRLFVQDTCARIINEMAGTATPSLLHQSWVGNIHIAAPASEAKIIQIHPRFYWISRKVTGKKGMYEPVVVTEDLALPVKISINYSSNLSAVNGSPFAKFYARFWHSYQGADQYTDLEIPFDLVSNWKNAEATLTTLLGYVIRYDLYLWISGLTGDLYFDRVESYHSGQNWARDPFCLDVNQGFTRAFYQIPKHWAGVTLPEGAYFESTYKDF
jgi:hypothetical protein